MVHPHDSRMTSSVRIKVNEVGLFAVQLADQLADSFAPNLLDRRADRCQRGGEVAGEGNIVEADNSHILWNASACHLKGAYCADGRVIVTGKDRVEFDPIQ